MGYPAALIQQVAEAGLAEGLAASKALIAASPMDQKSIKDDFGALNKEVAAQATGLGNGFYNKTIADNNTQMRLLNAQLALLNKQITAQAKAVGNSRRRPCMSTSRARRQSSATQAAGCRLVTPWSRTVLVSARPC